MTTMEVTEKKWDQFCARFQELCHGALVSIQLVQPDGKTRTIAQNVPLRRVALDDKSNPCTNNVVIETGRPEEKPFRHVVVEPIHIRLKNGNGSDRYHRLHLLAENGTTVVEFHPGVNPQLLTGLGQ